LTRPALRHVPLEERPPTAEFEFAGAEMACDFAGCLFWPRESLLVVSDLHLEKGATFAARGQLIPPYDTSATLRQLQRQIAVWRPARVVSLGDSFHDGDASARMPQPYRDLLTEMMTGREWIWIAGNHDPAPPVGVGGMTCEELVIGPVTFRHEPRAGWEAAEISGPLHPVARIARRGKTVRRRCFATDGTRMVMPAFGAYTGGLNIREPAFDDLFDETRLHAHLLGRGRVFTIAGSQLV